MTYIQRNLAATTAAAHRFEADTFGQGSDTCSGCGRDRTDRDHDNTAPTYAEVIALRAS